MCGWLSFMRCAKLPVIGVTASGIMKEFQNPLSNQGKYSWESGNFVGWSNWYFIISVRKIARAYGVHILLRFPFVLARAFGARISTNLYHGFKHKVPVSFRLVSILVKRKQNRENKGF